MNKSFLKLTVTLGLCVFFGVWIVRQFKEVRALWGGNFLVESIRAEQKKVEAKARAMTLNQLRPTFSEFLGYAQTPGKVGFPDHYARYYEHLVIYKPQDDAAWGLLAFCQYNTGHKEEAVANYQRAMFINPRCFWYPFNLGVIYFEQNDFSRSAAYLKIALGVSAEQTMRTLYDSKIYREILVYLRDFSYDAPGSLKRGYMTASGLLAYLNRYLTTPGETQPLSPELRADTYIRFF